MSWIYYMLKRDNIQLWSVRWYFKQKHQRQEKNKFRKVSWTEMENYDHLKFKDEYEKSLIIVMNQQVHYLEFHPISNSIWCGHGTLWRAEWGFSIPLYAYYTSYVFSIEATIWFLPSIPDILAFFSCSNFVSEKIQEYIYIIIYIIYIREYIYKYWRRCTFDLWLHWLFCIKTFISKGSNIFSVFRAIFSYTVIPKMLVHNVEFTYTFER